MVNRELLYIYENVYKKQINFVSGKAVGWGAAWTYGILLDEGRFCVHIHPYIIRSELILVKGSGLLQTWHALHKDAPLRALSHIWRETCLHHSFPLSLSLSISIRWHGKYNTLPCFTQLHYTSITNSCNNSD